MTVKQIDQPRTATRILEQSLIDIKQGRWLCGSFIHRFKEKPAGCALGLIGINGGNYPLKEFGSELVCLVTDEAMEDDCADWTEQSHQAIRLLYDSVSEEEQGGKADGRPVRELWSLIAEINDGMEQPEAEEWFSSAIALAKERGL